MYYLVLYSIFELVIIDLLINELKLTEFATSRNDVVSCDKIVTYSVACC